MLTALRTGLSAARAAQGVGRWAPTLARAGLKGAVPMDGNEAAAYVAYGMSDLHPIFPITPASPMGEHCDTWRGAGVKNAFGQVPSITEMQSEAGVSGTVHSAAMTGARVSTFTSSQGLLLMIPNLARLAGGLMPAVVHVASRIVAGQGIAIWHDQSDVMHCRPTGIAQLCSNSPQESMDLATVAHLAAMKASYPIMHFFDGFRTSHEINTVQKISYGDMYDMYDHEAYQRHIESCLDTESPYTRGTVQSQEHMFQMVESGQKHVNNVLPSIVECMGQVEELTGRPYQPFMYTGAPDAERVIVQMGSGTGATEEAVRYLTDQGEKVGVIKVHLFRPFSMEYLNKVLPKTVKRITVMDRTREATGLRDPLFLDVNAAVPRSVEMFGGRYGIAGKEYTPSMAHAIFDNMKEDKPRDYFLVGINDDVLHRNLPGTGVPSEWKPLPKKNPPAECIFWGIGGDGTVGANQNAISLIVSETDMYGQGYFNFSAHKSGGITVSHLRFGEENLDSATYMVQNANFIACHVPAYVSKFTQLLDPLKEGGTVLLNSPWETDEEVAKHLPEFFKKKLAMKKAKLFNVNASRIAEAAGLPGRTNMVMQVAFFTLSGVLPMEEAIDLMKKAVVKDFGKKGDEVIRKNHNAIDTAASSLKELVVEDDWINCVDDSAVYTAPHEHDTEFVKDIVRPNMRMLGDYLPVSTWDKGLRNRGIIPPGTTKYERRGFANTVADWIESKCTQCNMCAAVCPHACIRPFVFEPSDDAPEGWTGLKGKRMAKGLQYRIQVSPMDCTGCGLCESVCEDDAIRMVVAASTEGYDRKKQQSLFEYGTKLPQIPGKHLDMKQIKGVNFVVGDGVWREGKEKNVTQPPGLEFSGACSGCGETGLIKTLTQLFGAQMHMSNMAGCSCVWSSTYPNSAFTDMTPEGHGPAYGQGLFEDGAEFGFGTYLAIKQRRAKLLDDVHAAQAAGEVPAGLDTLLEEWTAVFNDREKSYELASKIKEWIAGQSERTELMEKIWLQRSMLSKKSHWVMGGDGWAYDIGFGGVDHVLSQGEDINLVVLDNEVYANTGGQASKATPRASMAKYQATGKGTPKKDLASMMLTYGNVYVAAVSYGSHPAQALRAIREAEAYDGPSLIVNYSPCIAHSLDGGLGTSVDQQKLAVQEGYHVLWRYNPDLMAKGKAPLIIDSKPPMGVEHLPETEARYSGLKRLYPEEHEKKQQLLAEDMARRYERLSSLAETLKEQAAKGQ